MSRELLLATRSSGKVRELVPMMESLGFIVVSLDDIGIAPDPREDDLEVFETFEENAMAKARWFAALSNGRPVIADDSGIEVDALDGRPGVRSKRWSGRADLDGQALDDANNAFLLNELRKSGATMPWSARYVCAAAWVGDGREVVVRGASEGTVITQPRGVGGFGYDPYFVSADFGRTFAETTREEKAQVSHRGRAFRSLIEALRG